MLASLHKYPQIKNINFFFGDIPKGFASNQIPVSWGPRGKSEINEFRTILNEFRKSQVTKKKIRVEYPWDVQVFNTLPIESPFSPSINGFTEEPFGSQELSILAIANQRLLFKKSENFSFGPGLKVTTFLSMNENQWWNNQIIPEINFSIGYKKFLKNQKILWSLIRVSTYINHNYYFVPSPSAAPGLGVGVRLYMGMGGDWLR